MSGSRPGRSRSWSGGMGGSPSGVHAQSSRSDNRSYADSRSSRSSYPSEERRRGGSRGTGGGDMVVRGSSRAFVVVIIFGVIAVAILAAMLWWGLFTAPQLSEQARLSHTYSLVVEPRRGTIYDRNGNILAISVNATTVSANPSEVLESGKEEEIAKLIADSLGGNEKDYLEAISDPDAVFAYVARRIDVDRANELQEKLQEEGYPGIYFTADSRREYPYGEVGGQVVGACNTEADAELNREYYKGISGIEAYYDEDLAGEPGYYEAEIAADGKTPIPGGVRETTAPVDGKDIVVSIDIEMQRSLEAYLADGLGRIGAASGTSVLMDAETGEIYAAASTPYFNPADREIVEEGSMQLKAISYLFEPGSIFKTVSAMSILETETMTPDDKIFAPATIYADGYEISDAHERGDATFTLRQIIDQSSNVGISLASEKMGFDELYNHILTYNLNSLSGVDYPGEQLGYLLDFDQWSKVTGYNVSFGQGISLTPIQIIRFYGALINDGVECTPHFLLQYPQTGEKPDYPTVDVIENKDAISDMRSMLRTVVTDGTGQQAAIEGYDVAGKTSTAEIYDEVNGGYRDGVYNLCFMGFIDNSSSKLVCFVGANEVYSDNVVTPIFKDIMSDAIDRYGITPNEVE